jgi:TIR domain
LRPRTFIREAISAYINAFNIDPRIVAPGVRALLLGEVANRSAAQTTLKEAVEYSARVRIGLPEPKCLDCVSAAVLAAVIGDPAFANEALDRLPLTPTDLPAVSGALEDLEIIRDSRIRHGAKVPQFVSDLENCLAEALKPEQAAYSKPNAALRARPAAQANDDKGPSAMDTKRDFFISYTRADRDWATWIAWTLEEANYTVVIQEWDFRPGSNFVLNMDKALRETKRTIVVLSEDFLRSAYTAAEWSAAFTKDPAGQSGLLVPVRVRECKPEGLLSSKVYVDLVGLPEDDAKVVLLGAFSGRTRPAQAPSFPGARVAPEPAIYPGEQLRGSRSEAIAAQIKRAAESERSAQPQPQALSRQERLNLIKQLNDIPAELFNMIIYAVNPPPGVVPPAPASQGQRSSALLLWAEGPAGHGVSEIQETLRDLLKS